MGRTSGSTSSTEPPAGAAGATRWVCVGRVAAAHGVRGELRLRVFGAGASALRRARVVALGREEAPRELAPHALQGVAGGRPGELRLTLEGVGDRDAAAALRGRFVFAAAELLEALAPGEHYGFELIGCRIEAEDGTPVGVVTGIWETGASDVLVLEAAGGGERLLPAALLRRVDVEAGRAVVELLPGLFDDEPGAGGGEA